MTKQDITESTAMAQVATAEPQMMPADPMVRMIEAVVMNPELPIERLEKMLDMKNKQEDRQREDQERAAKRSYFSDMAACQEAMPIVSKNQENKHTKSNYADIAAVLNAATPIYTRHGFSVNFHPDGVENDHLIMVWTISHRDGHQESGSARYPVDNKGVNGTVNKTGVQGLASTETYARRYLMLSLFNIATRDDNDGNAPEPVVDTLSEEQYRELRDLLDESGMSEVKFNLAFGHKDPENADLHLFPANLFDDAKKRLVAFKARKGEAVNA